MSSRALRKAQRQREEQQFRDQQLEAEEKESTEEEDTAPRVQNKASAFDLLGQVQDELDDESDENDTAIVAAHSGSNDDLDDDQAHANTLTSRPVTSKRKKKKKKRKAPKDETVSTGTKDSNFDEIDAALHELSLSARKADREGDTIQHNQAQFTFLGVETHHLHVRNEMRRLFGDISFDDPEEEAAQQQRRQGDQIGLSDAVKGSQSITGAGLPAVLRRRNPLIQGSEDWPKASGGGLSMEIERTNDDGSTLFKFVHNRIYQSAQREFEACVQSMDPNQMIGMLRYNPYHIGTLLQVSEIAKQEKDYSTAGDLVERALFSFGRAFHARFAQTMSQGKARLDFRRPENREFYLAAWRYIQNISMRATWRTAFEWAKMILQMSPDEDWYSIILCIDQFALRARQTAALLSLCDSVEDLSDLPNLQYSRALAQHMSGDGQAEGSLQQAVKSYPWVAARLCQTCGVAETPPSVWGSEPPTERTRLHVELYATQAADLWKTSDNVTFLTGVAEKMKRQDCQTRVDSGSDEVLSSEARHVLLLEKAPLISLVPSRLTAKLSSSSDPLPPSDDIRSYETGVSDHFSINRSSRDHVTPQQLIENSPQDFIAVLGESERLFALLEHMIPGIATRVEEGEGEDEITLSEEEASRALHQLRMPPQVFREVLGRLLSFRQALRSQPGSRVEGRDGSTAYFAEDGHLRIQPGREAEDESDGSSDGDVYGLEEANT